MPEFNLNEQTKTIDVLNADCYNHLEFFKTLNSVKVTTSIIINFSIELDPGKDIHCLEQNFL